MATVEFFEIKIKNKKTNKEIKDFNFTKLLQSKLENISDAMKYCTHGVRAKCSASLGDYKKSENNITFDFQKLQVEHIKSSLISELSEEVDLIEYTHQKDYESASYTEADVLVIKDLIENNYLSSLYEIIKQLKEVKTINKFSIFKIIKEKNLERKDEKNTLSQLFNDEVLRRFTINKTFFNIFSSSENRNILLMEKNLSGFNYTHLKEYFNIHLLKDEEYEVSIKYKYDKSFEHIIQYEQLNKFQFSLNLETPSLNGKEISPAFEKLLFQHFGNTEITIIVKPLDKKSSLINKKIVDFYDSAKNEGLLSSASITKRGQQKSIKSTTKDTLQFSKQNIKVTNLEEAHSFFQNAIQKNLK